MPTRELTFGEKAVGLTFNPSNDPLVQGIKEQFASVIDGLNSQRKLYTESNDFRARLFETAIENSITAQMYAVKGITWQY